MITGELQESEGRNGPTIVSADKRDVANKAEDNNNFKFTNLCYYQTGLVTVKMPLITYIWGNNQNNYKKS